MTRASRTYKVQLTEAAERDLREITRWTAERFGHERARVYAAILRQSLRALAAGPTAAGARARSDLGDHLHTLHAARRGHRARHLIVFRVTWAERSGIVEVLRILHDSIDLVRHLPADDAEKGAPE